MKNILLSPPANQWRKLVALKIESPEMFRGFNRGIQFLKLRPEPLGTSGRIVTAYLNDVPVGELGANEARFFHPEIMKLNRGGLELFLECKVTSDNSGRTILYRYMNRVLLNDWVQEQLRNAKEEQS